MITEKRIEQMTRNVQQEREWVKAHMEGDPLFASLANVQRDRVHIGRMYVAWHVIGGVPVIHTLFKVDSMTLGERGMGVSIMMASATRELEYIKLNHAPKKVPDLSLYMWLPNFSEVRYVPGDSKPGSKFYCSIPLLVKYQHPPSLSQVEDRLYFAPKSEFISLWPEHDF